MHNKRRERIMNGWRWEDDFYFEDDRGDPIPLDFG